MMNGNSQNHIALLQEYISLCQQALDRHRDAYPYKQIFDALDQSNGETGHPVTVTVADPIPVTRFTLSTKNLDDVDIRPKQCGGGDGGCCGGCRSGWLVETSYLDHVIANKDEYLEHPAKLDWDWLGFFNS